MQRDEPRLAELRPPDRQHALGEVDVPVIEVERLADAQTGHREQADQGRIARRALSRRRLDAMCGAQEPLDLLVAIDIGWLSLVAKRQEARGRDFCPLIRGAQELRKPPDDAEPICPLRRLNLDGALRPPQRKTRW